MKLSRLNPRLAAIAVPIAALVIAGCGGGGDTTEATQAHKQQAPAKLSKAEFISRGDGVCGEVNSAVGSIESSESESAASERAAEVASLYTGMVERLAKLDTPAEMDGYAEFSEAAEVLAKAEGEVKAAAEKEDSLALEEASNAAVPALEEFQNAAAVYGFEACSEAPSAPTSTTPAPAAGEEEIAPEEGGVEAGVEEEFVPEEEVAPEVEAEPAPEEEVAPETGGAGNAGGVGEPGGEAVPGEESSGGGIGPG